MQNRYSTILDFRALGKRLLFFGDADRTEMKEFVKTEMGNEPVDFAKVPHHGSNEGFELSFWEKIQRQESPCFAAITNFARCGLPVQSVYDSIQAALKDSGGQANIVPLARGKAKYLHYSASSDKSFSVQEETL